MANAEMKARRMIALQTTEKLIEQFELSELSDDEAIYTVRGWLMDELEKRNPEAFDRWIDSLTPSPRPFF